MRMNTPANRDTGFIPDEAQLAISLIRGRWRIRILKKLMHKPSRFGELHRAIDGISKNRLNQNLRTLERGSLIQRHEFRESPVTKVEYSLTSLGRSLCKITNSLNSWAIKNKAKLLHEKQK